MSANYQKMPSMTLPARARVVTEVYATAEQPRRTVTAPVQVAISVGLNAVMDRPMMKLLGAAEREGEAPPRPIPGDFMLLAGVSASPSAHCGRF